MCGEAEDHSPLMPPQIGAATLTTRGASAFSKLPDYACLLWGLLSFIGENFRISCWFGIAAAATAVLVAALAVTQIFFIGRLKIRTINQRVKSSDFDFTHVIYVHVFSTRRISLGAG